MRYLVVLASIFGSLLLMPGSVLGQDDAVRALAVGRLLGSFDVTPSALSEYRRTALRTGECAEAQTRKVQCRISYLAPSSEEMCRGIAVAAFGGYAEAMRWRGHWMDADLELTCPSYQVNIRFRVADRRIELTQWRRSAGVVVYENTSTLW